MSYAGYGRPDHIADPDDGGPFAFGQFDRSQRVGCFTGLGDRYNDIILSDDGISVAEFRSIFYFYRDPGQIFEQVFSYEACMPRSSASHHDDPFGLDEFFFVVFDPAQSDHGSFRIDASPHTIADGSRLLIDLLEHEMLVPAFFQFLELKLQLLDVGRFFLVLDVFDPKPFFPANGGYLFIFKINHVFRVLYDGGGVRGQEILAILLTYPDHQG